MLKKILKKKNKPELPPRALWQKLLRAVIALLVLLMLGWAFFPWLVPVDTLAKRFCQDASQQISAKVKFKRASLSWGNGLEIIGLKIDQPEGFAGPEDMIIIDSVRIPFNPYKLMNGKIDFCEIRGLCINAQLTEDGKLNLAALKKMPANTSPGEIKRLSLNESQIALAMPGLDKKIFFKIPNLQMRHGRVAQLGKVCMTASIYQQDSTPAPVSLQFAAQGQQSEHVAVGRFSFTGLDLAQIPLPGGDFPIKSLDGTCVGNFKFNITKQLKVDSLSLELTASDFQVTEHSGRELAKMDTAGIKLSASMDTMDHAIEIDQFTLQVPGLLAQGKARLHEEFLEGSWQGFKSININGQADPQQLANLMGIKKPDNQPEIQGLVNFDCIARNNYQHLEIDANIDATSAKIIQGEKIIKPQNSILSVSLESRIDANISNPPIEFAGLTIHVDRDSISGGGTINNVQDILEELEHFDPENPQPLVAMLPNLKFRGTLKSYLTDKQNPINGTWSISGNKRSHIRISLLADENTSLEFKDIFIKPKSMPMEAEFSTIIDSKSLDNIRLNTDLTLGDAAAGIDIKLNRDDENNISLAGTLNSKRSEIFITALPQLASDVNILGRTNGRITGKLSANPQQESQIKLELDLNRLSMEYDTIFLKPLAGPMWLDITTSWSADKQNNHNISFIAIAKDNYELFASLGCEAMLSPDQAIKTASAEMMVKNLAAFHRYSPEFQNQLNGGAISGGFYSKASLQNHKRHRLADVNIDFRDINCRGEFGKISLNGLWSANSKITEKSGKLNIIGQCKTDKLSLKINNDFNKPESIPANAMWNVAVDKKVDNTQKRKIRIRTLFAKLGKTTAQIGGTVFHKTGKGGDSVILTDIHGDASFTDAAELAALLPALKEYDLKGNAFIELTVKQASKEGHDITDLTFASKTLSGKYNDKPVSMAGKIFVDDIKLSKGEALTAKVKTDKLAFDLAGYSGYLLGDVAWNRGDIDGDLTMLCRNFNLKDFANWLEGNLQAQPTKRAPRLTDEQKQTLKSNANDFIAAVKPIFEKTNLTAKMSFNRFVGYDEAVQKYYDFDDVDVSLKINRGKTEIEYTGGLAGGLSRGKFFTDISKPNPTIKAYTEMLDVNATETLRPQIQKDFPGNFVQGTFTNIKDYTCTLQDFLASMSDDRYPMIMRGTGKMIANKGYVIGKAAPDSVVKIFPGLNLTEYHYNQMTAYQEYLDNGSSVNDAIFIGETYDVCMEGTTDIDKNINYMMGLQILGSITSSDWKHEWKQGRLPIFKLYGRIENGKLVNESVTFPQPKEAWGDVFIDNNVLYRAWLRKKKKQQKSVE